MQMSDEQRVRLAFGCVVTGDLQLNDAKPAADVILNLLKEQREAIIAVVQQSLSKNLSRGIAAAIASEVARDIRAKSTMPAKDI